MTELWTDSQASRELLLAKAETKERRQKRLEHFFREAYALTFGLKPGERRADDEAGEVVMRTSLSRAEFANALGMKQHDVFVRMMFNIVDKDGDGKISFQVSTFNSFNDYNQSLKYKAMNVERQCGIFVEPWSDSIHIALWRNDGFLHSFHNFSKNNAFSENLIER